MYRRVYVCDLRYVYIIIASLNKFDRSENIREKPAGDVSYIYGSAQGKQKKFNIEKGLSFFLLLLL